MTTVSQLSCHRRAEKNTSFSHSPLIMPAAEAGEMSGLNSFRPRPTNPESTVTFDIFTGRESLHQLDFLNILSKVSRGSVDEKLQWVFNLYDLNGDGLISKNEMVDVVQSIYEMLGRATQPAVDETSAKDHVEKIFTMIDSNKDGVITIDELVQWCSRDENFLRSLETLDTVL